MITPEDDLQADNRSVLQSSNLVNDVRFEMKTGRWKTGREIVCEQTRLSFVSSSFHILEDVQLDFQEYAFRGSLIFRC